MCSHTTSRWEKAATIAVYLEILIVAVSAGFIWAQLRQQKLQLIQQTQQFEQQLKLSRAANTQSLVELITPLNLRVTDREMAALWVKGFDGIDKIANAEEREIQSEQYQSLLASNMVFYENVYSQFCAGLLDEEIYKGWDQDLGVFIEAHNIAPRWDAWKKLYRKDFSDRVDEIIACQNQGSCAPTRCK
jgi:hypothetical protein